MNEGMLVTVWPGYKLPYAPHRGVVLKGSSPAVALTCGVYTSAGACTRLKPAGPGSPVVVGQVCRVLLRRVLWNYRLHRAQCTVHH
jgi:hypothetical protein